MEIPWAYLRDAVFFGALIWMTLIYRSHAKATKEQLNSLQENQDALLTQANTLKAHINTYLELFDRLKPGELVRRIEETEKAYAKMMDVQAREIEQQFSRERDEALKGKKTFEEQAGKLGTLLKGMTFNAVQASTILGIALYWVPKQMRTTILDTLGSSPVKDWANHGFQEFEKTSGPSPADSAYYGVSLSAIAAMAPSLSPGPLAAAFPNYVRSTEPQPPTQPPSDTEGMLQAPPDVG